MTEREQFEAWANDYGLRAEPNYSKHTEADCWAAWQAARTQPAITSESGNQAAQGASAITSGTAQAVPLLSEAEVGELLDKARVPELPNGYEDLDMQIARAVEQAVRAKLGVAVPMTDEQIAEISRQVAEDGPKDSIDRFVRAIERHHGIVGKEGA